MRWLKVGPPGAPWEHERLLRAIREHGLEGDIDWLDPVPDAELAALYSAADVYAQPSVWEGFGLPVLEAMSCGVPVVASAAASLPEVAGDAALLAPPGDEAALACAIGKVLASSGLARELASRGLARAAALTWEQTARLTIESYDRVLPGGALARPEATPAHPARGQEAR